MCFITELLEKLLRVQTCSQTLWTFYTAFYTGTSTGTGMVQLYDH